MDNLTFDWWIAFGMKSFWGGNHGSGSISQVAHVGDLSDEITLSHIIVIC